MKTFETLAQSFDVTLETFDGITDNFMSRVNELNDDLYDFAMELDTHQLEELSQYLDVSIENLDAGSILPTDLLECLDEVGNTLYELSVDEDMALMMNDWEGFLDS